ncbi:mitochondrial carrier domain-containing protein [Cladochytrium replicatum]|nr:mitochondrial carrier domain-containing protein [Cladochytrium replicatum]
MSTQSTAMGNATTPTAPAPHFVASDPAIGQPTSAHGRISSSKRREFAWKSFVAGGIAGCAAKTAIAPLDRVKILFQTSNPHYEKYSGSVRGMLMAVRAIRTDYGISGLFQGHSATLLRIFPYAAIKFMAYEQYRVLIMPKVSDETALRRMFAGSLAGVTSVFFSYPLELVRVRLAFEVRTSRSLGILSTVHSIYSEPNPFLPTAPSQTRNAIKGVANFYRGFLPSVYGIIPYAGVSFLTYDSFKSFASTNEVLKKWTVLPQNESDISQHPTKPHVRAWATLICGGLSGALAQTSSYPFEIIRRQMQVAGITSATSTTPLDVERSKALTSTLGTARYIFQRKGLRGFFVGLSIGFIKVVPMFAVSFYTYEMLKEWMGIDDPRDNT